MNKNRIANNKKYIPFVSFSLAALIVFLALAGCQQLSDLYAPTSYSVDDLFIDSNYAKMEVLPGYKNYSGKVIKVSPVSGGNWADYSKAVYRDLNLNDLGPFQIIVSMSLMVENPVSDRAVISAYRPSERVTYTPSNIKWKGPASIGWTIQFEESTSSQFGGKAIEAQAGQWMDLTFSEAIDFKNIGDWQIYLDGHNDHQGLLDLTLYIRHFQVTIRNSNKYIALTFDEGPSDFTHYLLDKLDELDVKATFFVTGMAIDAMHPLQDMNLSANDRRSGSDERKGVIKRIKEEGHDLANLSYSYNYLGGGKLDGSDGIDSTIRKENILLLADYSSTDYPLSVADIRKEIEDTQIAIQKAIFDDDYMNHPKVSNFFRIPYNIDPARALNLRTATAELGLPIIGGIRALTGDSRITVEQIADKMFNDLRPWEISINRDLRSDPSVLRMLDILVPKLKSDGYLFLTLSEMAEKRRFP